VGGDLTLNAGTTLPGNGPGTLHVKGDFAATSAQFFFQIADTTSYDRLDVSGSATTQLTSLFLSKAAGYQPKAGDAFFLLTQGGTASPGEFRLMPEGLVFSISGGGPFAITYHANWTGSPVTSSLFGGNDVALYVVPEPAAGAAALVAAGAFLLRRRKQP
jgi:hypothetical protein